MQITAAAPLEAVKLLTPRRHDDERGFFSEVWRADWPGVDVNFVQDNHSLSRVRGTLRGLHFQTGASAQAKLVRCTRGSILDVAVDIRHGSPTFGQHAAVVLSEESWQQLFVPVGFAHGFCTLEPNTEVIYKVSAYYDAAADRGLAWDDPALAIHWPITAEEVTISIKDSEQPRLAELAEEFPYVRHRQGL